jgi:hypothetical protein
VTTMHTAPRYLSELVDGDPHDGYWIQAADINGDGRLDLVASGLTTGEVVWYENPAGSGEWRKHHIATVDKAVALDCGDIAGQGRIDIAICHDYGECMFNCRPNDGKISWLHNPGTYDADETWRQRLIGDLVATHRVVLGHFTPTGQLELLALPVVGPGGAAGVDKPVELTLFERPADVLSAENWTAQVVDSTHFRIVHGVITARFPGSVDPQRESVLLASQEGISWFGPGADTQWEHQHLGAGVGLQNKPSDLPRQFKGSGNLAVGRLGDDPYGYIAAIEPFHGNTIAVYTRAQRSHSLAGAWQRTTLAVLGDPAQPGMAVGHHVIAADLDGDGDDEFLVALRGPAPWQGVLQYKLDIADGIITAAQVDTVSTYSTARIAIGDFTGDGRLDFATTGYHTAGYYLAPDPQIRVFHNQYGNPLHQSPPRSNG